MKSFFIRLSFLLLILSLFFSCETDPLEEITGTFNTNYNESLEKWESLRSAEGNSYFYIARQPFGFNFFTSTKITVREGEVVERSCNFFSINEQDQMVLDSSYLETGAELGTNPQGSAIRNMDEIYNTCAETYLFADPNRYEIVFETFENGILKECGFTYTQCRNECFQGVMLTEFEWL
ncbi:MAG: hypothetical protein R8P61_22085 [Bacteroidia bacterium]|nr:hypothetical protein [Bacteroidia bacterium]